MLAKLYMLCPQYPSRCVAKPPHAGEQVQLAAPLLQTLRLGSSQYPGVPHLTSLDLASACLTQASWRNLPYLHSLQLACSGLTSLHLACCDALPDRALQNLTPSPLHAGCPNLQ